MPWQEVNVMTLRREFVELAAQEGANVSELCRRYEISRKTGYKWLGRGGAGSGRAAALQDRSRRPLHCPQQTEAALEREVVKLRLRHPCWGGRKIAWRLAELGQAPLTPSTVTRILHRHGQRQAPARAGVRALWTARAHQHGQRPALGRAQRCRSRLDRTDHLDDSTGHPRQPQPAGPSADQRQDRTLPPDLEEGGARRSPLR